MPPNRPPVAGGTVPKGLLVGGAVPKRPLFPVVAGAVPKALVVVVAVPKRLLLLVVAGAVPKGLLVVVAAAAVPLPTVAAPNPDKVPKPVIFGRGKES